ncbi:MAG: hypothetical protein E7A71_00280 [Enterococcus faecium]|nr:hypothetical protein [Enterococcus faecium]
MSKRFIVPLPGLVTNDGQQQYLTNRKGKWFACRRHGKLRQTWKEEHLDYIPEIYRQFAVDLLDYVPEICWKPAMVLEDSKEEKVEERNKIYKFIFDSEMIAFGSIIGRFGPVIDLEDVRKEIMTSDFITIEGAGGKTLIATKHIKAVEEA